MNDPKSFFTKTFPIIRDILIFSAAIVTVAFNYFASPVREDIRAAQKDIVAIREELSTHESDNVTNQSKLGDKLDIIQTSINRIDVRLSRIEGSLNK